MRFVMIQNEHIQQRRSGLSLLEVLVAIFIMGIGLLALLTLFPIGILTMMQAIQHDRTAMAAGNATAVAQAHDVRHDIDLVNPALNLDLYKQPHPDLALIQRADSPSHALYIDPIGTRFSDWVGHGPNTAIRRVPVSFAKNNLNSILPWFSSMDDIVFGYEGQPAQLTPPPNPQFERQTLFSWAYMVRRPMNGAPSVVELTVVVYDSRPTSIQPAEMVYANAVFSPPNFVSINWPPGLPPNLSLGSWILDCTAAPGPDGKLGPSNARFYRVVGITQTGPTSADLELETPIQGFPPGGGQGTIVVMEGVAEVYEMSAGWRP